MRLSVLIDQLIREFGPARVRYPGDQIEHPTQEWRIWTTVADSATLLSRLSYRELVRVTIPATGTDKNDLSVDDTLLNDVRRQLLQADLLAPKDRPLGLAFMPDPIWHSPVTISLVVFGPDS